jgi:hypothetical protein
MLCFGGAGRIANFGADLRVSRQFSSLRANIPGAVPPLNKQFKALVIADPAPEEEFQLAGARAPKAFCFAIFSAGNKSN